MNNQMKALETRNISVRLSKSGAIVIIKDELGATTLVNANLLRHALGIPYTKKDGTFKSAAMIKADNARAQRAYQAAATRSG